MKPRISSISAGFSMIEVLVTMVVVSVGLLGLSKMQAAAIANTKISRVRSLVAMQAASLAGAMHGNTAYWAAGVAPARFTATGSDTVTDSTGVLTTAGTDCSSANCTAAQLAAYDVHTWTQGLNANFPDYSASVNCINVAGAPVNCNINITWTEKVVAINRTTAVSTSAQTSQQSFTLFVEP